MTKDKKSKIDRPSYALGKKQGYIEGENDGYARGEKQGYIEGENDGYRNGYRRGETDGYARGETDGYARGEKQGYIEGETDGDKNGYARGETEGYARGETEGYARGEKQGYIEGETDGYRNGYKQGKNDGYARGKKQGYTDGENDGYARGKKQGYFNSVLICATVLISAGIIAVPIIRTPVKSPEPSEIEPQPDIGSRDGSLSLEELPNMARSITVRVLSGQSSGSGIIIEQQDGFYTVLTNGHVLNKDEQHKIKTPDSNIHEAKLLFQFDGNESGDDLAVLQFSSTESYNTVKLDLSGLQTSEQVLAAGFPFDSNKLVFLTGNITVILEEALKGGYQIAYLIDIQKGMSGGPLLNSKGALVGVNGKHQPLWKAPYRYKNGSEVREHAQEELDRYSWAIPIQRFLQHVPPVLLSNLDFINLPKAIDRKNLIEAGSGNIDAKISYQKQEDRLVQVQLTLTHSGKEIQQDEVLPTEAAVNIHDIDLQIVDLDNDGEPEVIVDIIAGKNVRYSYSWIYRLVPEKQVYEGNKHLWGPVDDRPSYQVEDSQSEEGEKTILLQSFNRQFARELVETDKDKEAVFPLQLWQYSQGELRDVTEKYPDIVKKHNLLMFREYVVRRDRDRDLKNVLAAYLAEKYLLDRREEGWEWVKAAYKKEEDRKEYFDKLRIALEGMGYNIRYGGRS